jgi:hypothetical protein
MFQTLILLAVTLSAAAAPAPAENAAPAKELNGMPLVFSDDFEKSADNWEPTDAKAWKVTDEDGNKGYSLFQQSKYDPPVRSPKNISWVKDLKVKDFVLEARIKQTGREYGHRDFCVFFGRKDASHFYYVHMATTSDEHANSIFLVNGAPRVSIAKERTTGTVWDKEYHTVRVVRNAQTGLIQVFRDDMTKPIMTAEDKNFTDGEIGFGSFDDTGVVDDVRVWATRP